MTSCLNKKEQKENSIETNAETETVEKTVSEIDTAKINIYSTELKDWLHYYEKYSLKAGDFDFIKQNNLPDINATVDSFDISNDIYKPFYKYSADSSIILDLISYNLPLEKNENNELVSYGGDIDSEVSVKDLKNNIWKRILFVGSFYIIEDGFWINKNQLLIVGQFNDTDQEKYKPSIWFVDLKANTIQIFEYQNYIDNMKPDYLENVIYKDVKMAE